MTDDPHAGSMPEQLLTFHQAAKAVGAKYWQIQRLCKSGALQVYKPYNSRSFVKQSELTAYIDSCRVGGVE